jgi:hypothetical protein
VNHGVLLLAALSPAGHAFVAVVTAASVLFVVRLVRREQLQSKYSLLWIAVAIAMAAFASFPRLLDNAAEAVGIDYPPAAFLAVAVTFLFVIVVQFSWEISRLNERTRRLAEEVALLRAVPTASTPPSEAVPPGSTTA